MVGDRGEQRNAFTRDGVHVHLERKIRNHSREVSVSGSFAIAVDATLKLRDTDLNRGQRVSNCETCVIVAVDTERCFDAF